MISPSISFPDSFEDILHKCFNGSIIEVAIIHQFKPIRCVTFVNIGVFHVHIPYDAQNLLLVSLIC